MKELFNLVSAIALILFSFYTVAEDKQTSTEGSMSLSAVRIEYLKYYPDVIKITPGTTVRWINADSIDHDVTSGKSITGRKSRGLKKTKFPDGVFSSGLFGKDRTFSKTFDKQGVYPYYCSVHPFMKGKVVVAPKSSETFVH